MRTNETNYASLWAPIIRTQNHMNGTDVINTLSEGGGKWGHGMQEAYDKVYIHHPKKRKPDNNVYAVEAQYYVSSNQNKIMGYVKNRTFNVYTSGFVNTKCKNDPNLISIIGSKSPINTPRNIKWKDIQSGKRIKVDNLQSIAKYNIDFYSFQNGNYISSTTKFTNIFGKLRIEYPELITHDNPLNPVIWFVARKINDNALMESENPIEKNEEFKLIDDEEERMDSTDFVRVIPKVYPIPFHDFLLLESNMADEAIIADAFGKKMDGFKVKEGINRFETKKYASGIYFMELVHQNIIFKIQKQ